MASKSAQRHSFKGFSYINLLWLLQPNRYWFWALCVRNQMFAAKWNSENIVHCTITYRELHQLEILTLTYFFARRRFKLLDFLAFLNWFHFCCQWKNVQRTKFAISFDALPSIYKHMRHHPTQSFACILRCNVIEFNTAGTIQFWCRLTAVNLICCDGQMTDRRSTSRITNRSKQQTPSLLFVVFISACVWCLTFSLEPFKLYRGLVRFFVNVFAIFLIRSFCHLFSIDLSFLFTRKFFFIDDDDDDTTRLWLIQ